MLQLVPDPPTSEADTGPRPCPQCGGTDHVESIDTGGPERFWCTAPACNRVFVGGQDEWAQWLTRRLGHQAWMRLNGRPALHLV